MRIVAGHAGDPRIAVFPPAPALFQAIRLRTNVRDSHRRSQLHIPPRAVTGTTKVNGIDRIELAGIEDCIRLLIVILLIALQHLTFGRGRPLRCCVLQARPMASFACNPRNDPAAVKLVANG